MAVKTLSVNTNLDFPYITSITADQMGLARQVNTIVNLIQQQLTAHAVAINNLPPGNLNAGTNASNTTFWRGDGTWATAIQSIPVTYVQGPATSVVGDVALFANTSGNLLSDGGSWTTITQNNLSLFSSTKQGVVPSSAGFSSSGDYLGGDGNWHVLPASPAQSFVYLGTIAVSGGAITDSPSGTNIFGANGGSYRSLKIVFRNVLPTTSSALLLQVHSGGSFQTTASPGYAYTINGSSIANSSITGTNALASSFQITLNSASTSGSGISGELTIGNVTGTSQVKPWYGCFSWQSPTAAEWFGCLTSGAWMGTGAIDGFEITDTHSSTDLASGSVDIYGML